MVSEAKKLLEMTPVLPERQPRGETLRHDEEVDGYLDHCMVFTDISMDKDNKVSFPPSLSSSFPFSSLQSREVVVREPTGVLREATWEERDRMMQVYFPTLGRRMWLPHMLTEEGLLPVLEAGRYRDILDMVCLQCEPDSADYIRVSMQTIYPENTPMILGLCVLFPPKVHHTVYDRIEVDGAYSSLWSTRHFGGLVWYLVQQEKMVGLVRDLVEREL